MSDPKIPVSWYAVISAQGFGPPPSPGSNPEWEHAIEAYLNVYDNMSDPKLERLTLEGRKHAKLTSSRFDGISNVDEICRIAHEITNILTGILRIHERPRDLVLLHLYAVYGDGTHCEHKPTIRLEWDLDNVIAFSTGKVGPPRLTDQQEIAEYVLKSQDQHILDVLGYLSLGAPDFYTLYKIYEVIASDLSPKGRDKIRKSGWIPPKVFEDFLATANQSHRHWDITKPPPKMGLAEARQVMGRIIDRWIGDKAGIKISSYNAGVTFPWM